MFLTHRDINIFSTTTWIFDSGPFYFSLRLLGLTDPSWQKCNMLTEED